MCIVFYTLTHPGYKLILASNRDEFLDRPTLPASWHKFEPLTQSDTPINGQGDTSSQGKDEEEEAWVLSGRDVGSPSGGTWLGMTRDLRIAVLTNIRVPPVPIPPNAPSRGLLLKQFLATPPSAPQQPVLDYLTSHKSEVDQYEGFNLLLFNLHPRSASASSSPAPSSSTSTSSNTTWGSPEVGYLSNRPVPTITDVHSSESAQSTSGPGQCIGLSNSPLAEPWPKVLKGQANMQRILEESNTEENQDELIEKMMELLQQSIPLDSLASLQDCTCLHPVALGRNPDRPIKEGEKRRWYGTRISTLILVKDSGEVTFVERDIFVQNGQGEAVKGDKERKYTFMAQGRDGS